MIETVAVDCPHERPLVIAAEDDESVRALVRIQLEQAGFEVMEARDGQEAIDLVEKVSPDIVLLDLDMPVKNGYEVLKFMKASAETADIPVLLLTAQSATDDIVTGLNLGAHDHVSKPFAARELLARTEAALRVKRQRDESRRRNESLAVVALVDALTGLGNRRAADDHLHEACANASRHQIPLSIAIIDVDFFKRVNDTYGHVAGDTVLKEFGARVRNSLREGDFAGRWGGEEFLVILPLTGCAGAEQFGERLRFSIDDTPFLLDEITPVKVTASIGLANGNVADRLVDDADKALFTAKAAGRNCVR